MPLFSYLGDHETVTCWGLEFPRGVAVSVEDPHAIGKLRGNGEFSETIDGSELMPDKLKRKYTKRKDA